MNSLEALENWYNTESPKTKAYEYEQHYRIIKHDLEVLEKLKELIIQNKDNHWYVDIQEIKEWLKDEKEKN